MASTANAATGAANSPPEGNFVFFSELLNLPVLGPGAERLGRLKDVVLDGMDPAYPAVRAIVVRLASRAELRRVEWADFAELSARSIRLRRGAEALLPTQKLPNEILLAEDVLDRQLVDTDGAKVRRANDLHFVFGRGELRLAHVDVGMRGLVRRIGWQSWMDGVVRALRPHSRYLTEEDFVRWKNVQPLGAQSPRLRLDVTRSALSQMHPADLAEIFSDLDRPERAALFGQLPMEAAADTLEEADSELQRELLRSVKAEKAADLLEAMEPDEAADLLGDLPADESAQFLAAMDTEERSEIQQLLQYPQNAAGGIMTPDFVRVAGDETVAQAIEDIRRQASGVKHINDVFATDSEGRLAGFVSLRDLLLASPSIRLSSLIKEHPAPLHPEDSANRAAELAAKYKLLSLPVQTEDGKLLGVVTIDDVLEHAMHG